MSRTNHRLFCLLRLSGVPDLGFSAGGRSWVSESGLVNWYIETGRSENGEFGGGLSDDSDFPELVAGDWRLWVVTPDKIKASLLKTIGCDV